MKETDKLLREAEEALDSGDWYESLDLLRRAVELEPDNTLIAERYSQLRQLHSLEEKLRETELDYLSKLETDSIVDAYQALRDGLYAIADHLPQDKKELFLKLIRNAEPSRLGNEESRQAAQNLLADLGRLSAENRAYRKVYFLSDRLIDLGYDLALRGVVASASQLGDLFMAYRAAREYLHRHPRSEEAISQLSQVTEGLLSQLSSSATKRLHRAQENLEIEEFELALGNLRSISEIFEPVREEFPDLLKYDDVEQILDKTSDLWQETKQLQAVYQEVAPKIQEAEELFVAGQLDEAEQMLSQIGEIPLVNLSRRVLGLREQVRKAKVDSARKILHTELASVQVSLGTLSSEESSRALGRLRALLSRIDWTVLPSEDRRDYERTLEQVYRRLQISSLFEQSRVSVEAGDSEKAYAIITSIPEQDNPEVQALFKEIEQGLERQRREHIETSVKKLLQRAKDDFFHKRFLSAERALDEIDAALGQISEEYRILWKAEAESLREEIKATSNIWSAYTQAQVHVWEGHKEGKIGNLREANALLEQVINTPPNNDIVQDIQAQARELMDAILMGTYMMDGNLQEVERHLIRKMMLDPTNIKIRLNLVQVRATKDVEELTKQIKIESRLWFWATATSTMVAFTVFVVAVVFALRDNNLFASLNLLLTVLTGFLAKAFSTQYQKANERSDRELEDKLREFIKQQTGEAEKLASQEEQPA